jgi:hypothetical protein
MNDIKKYTKYFIPILTIYLLILSYYPKMFKFFGNEYCQLLMVLSVIFIYFNYPSMGWLLGIIFLLTYKSYHNTQFIKEAFTQKEIRKPEKTLNNTQDEIKRELTKNESSVIETIQKKFSDSIDALLEHDLEKLQKYTCVSNEEGIGLPDPVKVYDLSKTINFDF